jgi:hypothetical protein
MTLHQVHLECFFCSRYTNVYNHFPYICRYRLNLGIYETENPPSIKQYTSDGRFKLLSERIDGAIYEEKQSGNQLTNLCVLPLYILHGRKEEIALNYKSSVSIESF